MDDVADAVALAKQAGDATRPGPEAYGKLCIMVPIMLGSLQDLVVDGLDAATHSLRDTADRLRGNAGAYQTAEDDNAGMLRRMGGPQ